MPPFAQERAHSAIVPGLFDLSIRLLLTSFAVNLIARWPHCNVSDAHTVGAGRQAINAVGSCAIGAVALSYCRPETITVGVIVQHHANPLDWFTSFVGDNSRDHNCCFDTRSNTPCLCCHR